MILHVFIDLVRNKFLFSSETSFSTNFASLKGYVFHVVVMVEEVGAREVQVTLLAFFGSVMVVDVGSKLPGTVQHFAAWGTNLEKK